MYLFCSTFFADQAWRPLNKEYNSGKIKVYGCVNENLLKKLWMEIKKINEKASKMNHFLICFVDCVGQPGFKVNQESGVINMMVSKGNHDGISLIWDVQKFTNCSTIMRCNAEVFMSFNTSQEDEIKHIHKEFGIGSGKDFSAIFQACTAKRYSFFFVNRQGAGAPDYYHDFKFITEFHHPSE